MMLFTKRPFLVSLLILPLLLSCHSQDQQSSQEEENLQNHLPASLVDNPRTLQKDTVLLTHDLGILAFADTLHDFGRVKEGEVVSFDFEFTNTGKKEILIDEAKASCGCTVPQYPQYPVLPGKKDKIKVTFNSQGKTGYNEKGIIIRTNGNPSIYNLHIRAEVE